MSLTEHHNTSNDPSDAPGSDPGHQSVEPPRLTVPGLDEQVAAEVVSVLEHRLASLLDLQLTLKHIHWNVVGVNFISVHEFLDPQVDSVRAMSDATAERIAALGGEPKGTPGAIVATRTWDDYGLGRAPTVRHLAELDRVYAGVIIDHREAAERLGELDPVSEDLLIGHLHDLEQYQWFVRAHLQNAEGDVVFRENEREASREASAERPSDADGAASEAAR